MSNWKKAGEKYLFTYNGVAILYALLIGGAAYGINKLLTKLNIEAKFDYKKLFNSPITASATLAVAFALTISLAAIYFAFFTIHLLSGS